MWFQRHVDDARYVWNLALEQTNMYRRSFGPTPNKAERGRQLTEARQGTWLGEGSSMVQQMALRDFDDAWHFFLAGKRGRPTWRTKHRSRGFAVRDLAPLPGRRPIGLRVINSKWAEVRIPMAGWVKFRMSRPFPEGVKSARINYDSAGRWHINLVAPQPRFARTGTGESVGIDFGLRRTMTLSNGQHMDMPTLLTPAEARRQLRLRRQRSRQQPGSKRSERTRQRIGRLRMREVDRRKDWIEKSTTEIVRRFDHVSIEELTILNMARTSRGTADNPGRMVKQKKGLNKAIYARAWGVCRIRLTDKAAASTSPVVVVAVSARNTSRCCSACGHTAKENRESQATFLCRACGFKENADVNAAKNINAAGLAVSGRGGQPHERPCEASTDPVVGGQQGISSVPTEGTAWC